MDRAQIFFTSFWRLCSKKLHGIGTTERRRPVGPNPSTTLENRVKRSITIDPTVGSRSNFFHEFPEAVFDGVAWNRYDTLTASGRGHSTNTSREPVQKVLNYRSDRWIALKCYSRVSGGCFRWSCVESVRHADDVRSGHSSDNAREPGQKVHNYRSDSWIALKFFSPGSRGCVRGSCLE